MNVLLMFDENNLKINRFFFIFYWMDVFVEDLSFIIKSVIVSLVISLIYKFCMEMFIY